VKKRSAAVVKIQIPFARNSVEDAEVHVWQGERMPSMVA
jgi:hypothetical protein